MKQFLLNFFEQGGRLQQCLPNFESRNEQKRMAENVVDALLQENISLIEAGTGTGKSLAYLLPAVYWAISHKEKVVISTKTINLQEQLLHKDLPLVKKALQMDFQAVLVKGMNNYLCLRKLEEELPYTELFDDNVSREIGRIKAWAETVEGGSRSDLGFNPSQETWERVGAEGDTCTWRKCPYYQQCHFVRAREKLEDAQVFVVNHHLLFADIAMRAEGEEKGVLPQYQHIILDEAHHIEDVATEFFAARVSRLGILRTIGKITSEKGKEGGGKLPQLKKKLAQLREGGNLPALARLQMELPTERREVVESLIDCFHSFEAFCESFGSREKRKRLEPRHYEQQIWKEEVTPSVHRFIDRTLSFCHTLQGLEKEVRTVKDDDFQSRVDGICGEIAAYASRLEKSCAVCKNFIDGEHCQEWVKWIETSGQNIELVDAKLTIAEHLAEHLWSRFKTIILCSATMTTNRNFDFMKGRLGFISSKLSNRIVTEHIYDSPFNYRKQSLVLLAKDLPPPSHPGFIEKAAEKILDATVASRGSAFVLFTSYTMMTACFSRIREELERRRFSLFLQGTAHRKTLLKQFKETKRAILFGTDSFWEGVDVAGDALRLVILVKLPFKVPSEPIIEARAEQIAQEGGDPFLHYSLPMAIVKFKQGVGRLIRHKTDKGVILILDPRIINKGYGQQFRNSLPASPCLECEGDKLPEAMRHFFGYRS